MSIVAGVDIGGTKCGVSIGQARDADIQILAQRRFSTPPSPYDTIKRICTDLDGLLTEHAGGAPIAIGVSCGGPLDSGAGLILAPPNLPTWDRIDVVAPLRDHFGVPVGLQNDANGGALAEWLWGAGRGLRNMIFLTFGTGMGAGLILGGRLYEGTNGLAGEVGHMRLAPDGPTGYGKAGSFEGFCSGGGMARLARTMAAAHLRGGHASLYCSTPRDLPRITTEIVGVAAQQGDSLALEVFRIVGQRLGQGLALLVDILNPERIVIGSVYQRQRSLLEPIVLETLRREALPQALSVCSIEPAGLGEQVGDMASMAVAMSMAPAAGE